MKIDLIKGDCLEEMKKLKDSSIDLIVTSPPYYNAREYSHWDTYSDYLLFLENCFSEIFKLLKEGRMCCVNLSVVIEPRANRRSESKRIPIPFHFVCLMEKIGFKFLEDIIWVKPEGSAKNRNGRFYQDRNPIQYKPNIVNEYIFVFQKPMKGLIDKIIRQYKKIDNGQSKILGEYERSNLWSMNPETKSKHSAPFPVELPEKLINYYSYKNDVILEPFMGSGTTGIACIKNNRNFIGIELDDNYFDMSKNRVNAYIEENNIEDVELNTI